MAKKTSNKRCLKVIELFAGVGGFRLGLKNPRYRLIWANQWEPATKGQHAAAIYKKRFKAIEGEDFSCEDIATVDTNDMPDHDLFVGGFPCQDYSVARSLNDAVGIEGKKGVLWWQIYRILSQKKKNRPKYLILENVDRLLKSPSNQRGRDFAIMLASLSDLGYAIEWRVINAADYGFPQRRRRVFIMAYHETTNVYRRIARNMDLPGWVFKEGSFAKAFPILGSDDLVYPERIIEGDLADISGGFNKESSSKSPFENTGIMIKRTMFTVKTYPKYEGKRMSLGDVLVPDKDVPEEYYIKDEDIPLWKYLKGAKHILKKSNRTGRTFKYDEGSMVFPDDLKKPSRTIVTGEGGSTPSRFKHVIRTRKDRLRRLTPIELERLNMFPDNHTEGESPAKRAFFMGNALVVGVVKRLGQQLIKTIDER